MSSTSIERLERLQRIYPGAVGQGVIEGSQHLVRRQLRIWESRGEVVGLRRFERVNLRAGTTHIPYVRMKTRKRVWREQASRAAVLAAAGVLFLGAVCWMAWEARYVILAAAGVAALGTLALLAWPHWTRGCSGLHCPGCRG